MDIREGCRAVIGTLLGSILVALIATVARADGWPLNPNNSAVISEWFQSLMQPDHPRISCCGEADSFEADEFETEGDHYIAVITDGRGVMPNGTRIPVPNEKMKFDSGNPTGHGVLFIGSQGQIFCFVVPGGA